MVCKWGIAVAAFAYLLSEGMFSSAHFSFSARSVPWLLYSLACAVITVSGTAVRFYLLLCLLGQSSRLSDIVKMFFSGMLFQLVGSEFAFDGMRVIVLRKQGLSPVMIGSSVLADRLFGVSSILLIAFFFSLYYLKMENFYWLIMLGLALLFAIPVAFIAFWRFRGSSGSSFLCRIPGSRLALAMGETLELLARKPIHIALLSLFSLLPFLTVLFASYCNAQALENVPLSCSEAMTGASFASLTAILPLPLAGVGVGESAFGWVVSMLRGGGEIVEYASVFFISRLVMLTVACVSWVVTTCVGGRPDQ